MDFIVWDTSTGKYLNFLKNSVWKILSVKIIQFKRLSYQQEARYLYFWCQISFFFLSKHGLKVQQCYFKLEKNPNKTHYWWLLPQGQQQWNISAFLHDIIFQGVVSLQVLVVAITFRMPLSKTQFHPPCGRHNSAYKTEHLLKKKKSSGFRFSKYRARDF